MNVRTALMLGALALVGSPVTAAFAQSPAGFYVGAGVGAALVDTQPTTFDILMGTSSFRLPASSASFGVGFGVVGSVGYGLGNGFRLELEGDYRQASQSQGSGSQSSYGVFANGFYDIDLGVGWVVPYVGLGVGYQMSDWNNVTLQADTGPAVSGPVTIRVNDGQGQFAYHAIVGVAFPIDYVPGLSVTAEYRFTGTVGSRTYSGVATPASATPAPTRVHASADTSSTFLVGLRYAFETANPPEEGDMSAAVPVPAGSAAAIPRTYVVFFDWNVSALNARARDVVAEAARASTSVAHTRIEVSGHTDSTGTPEANIAISKARADAVADELVRWGIRRADIAIHAWGDERPAVKTGPGVREEKNRRVEIVYD